MSNETIINEAEQTVTAARATVATSGIEAAQIQAEVAALQARLAQLQPTAPTTAPTSAPSITPTSRDAADLAEFKAHKARERNVARLDTLKGYGLNTQLSEEQVLRLAPDVDPRDPDGMAAFHAFRDQNQHFFVAAADPLEAELRASPALAKMRGAFNADKLIANRAKLALAEPPARRPAPPFDVEAMRSDLVSRSSPAFNGADLAWRMLGAPAAPTLGKP